MAVPTVTSVNPDSGLTRGDNVIEVHGTNFKLPGLAEPFGYQGGAQQKTVSVQFDGVESAWAYAATDSMIFARVPEYRGPYDVTYPVALDVRVANLDDTGIEIPGENATLADGYRIRRPGIATEAYLQRVVREFLRMFRRHVLQNSHVSANRDAISGTNDDRLKAQLPAIYLIGPEMIDDRLRSYNQEAETTDPTDLTRWYRKRPGVTLELEFEVVIITDSERHLHALSQATVLHFRDVVDLRVPEDGAAPDGPYKDYELDMLWPFRPTHEDDPNPSNLIRSSSRVVIRGVQVDEEAGTIIQMGSFVNEDEPTLDVQSIDVPDEEYTYIVDDATGFFLTDDSGDTLLVEG